MLLILKKDKMQNNNKLRLLKMRNKLNNKMLKKLKKKKPR